MREFRIYFRNGTQILFKALSMLNVFNYCLHELNHESYDIVKVEEVEKEG